MDPNDPNYLYPNDPNAPVQEDPNDGPMIQMIQTDPNWMIQMIQTRLFNRSKRSKLSLWIQTIQYDPVRRIQMIQMIQTIMILVIQMIQTRLFRRIQGSA